MKTIFKWLAVAGGVLVVLIAAAALIVPQIVDVQKYKPVIEKKVVEATGRNFSVGSDIQLSVFPWLGVSISDVHLGNLQGFQDTDFLKIKSFDVRVKLLPLISKEIQVEKFVLNGPELYLEKRKDGKASWEGFGGSQEKEAPGKTVPPEPSAGTELPISSLVVGEFSVKNGLVQWNDMSTGQKKTITGIDLDLKDVTLESPIRLAFKAVADGQPVALRGSVGPLGKDPGKGKIPLDFEIEALGQLKIAVKGSVTDPAVNQQFDLAVSVSDFSPRKLAEALKLDFPVETSDPKAINRVGAFLKLKGDTKSVTVSDSSLVLDDSTLKFNVEAASFANPDIRAQVDMDTLDLDRYLPPKTDTTAKAEAQPVETTAKSNQSPMDYSSLRKPNLDVAFKIKNFKANGVRIQDIVLKLSGKSGVYNLEPFSMALYQGSVSSKATLDVRSSEPKTSVNLEIKDLDSGLLINDVLSKEMVKGVVNSSISLSMTGDTPEKILKTLSILGDFSFKNGMVTLEDESGGQKKTITDIDVDLKNISFDRPIQMDLKAVAEGQPLNFKGSVGPMGKNPEKGEIPLDVRIDALDQLKIALKGTVNDLAARRQFDLSLSVSEFSPRKLAAALKQEFPILTADPNVLNRVGVTLKVKGDPTAVTVSNSSLILDESTLAFSLAASEFSKPNVKADISLDAIDLDRYLPPPDKKKEQAPAAAPAQAEAIDYEPLRKPVLDFSLKAGKLKAHGATIENLVLKLKGASGIYTLDPFSMNLYQGSVSSRVGLDVAGSEPKADVNLETKGVQSGPLLRDTMKKDILEGAMEALIELSIVGDTPERIKKTLTGNGNLKFYDGAIVGYDLAGMVRNVQTSFGMAEKAQEKPKTDFAELEVPFTAKDGLVTITEAKLLSPLMRLVSTGKTDLTKETLDFRVEPKLVATLKGQGDTMDRSGFKVPVLITGTFTQPKFRPDLKGLLENEIPDKEKIQEILQQKDLQKENLKSIEEGAKNLLKGFPFGKQTESTQKKE